MRDRKQVDADIDRILESCGWDEQAGVRHRLAALRAELGAIKQKENGNA